MSIKACVFYAHGTLFDLASTPARCQDLPERFGLAAQEIARLRTH